MRTYVKNFLGRLLRIARLKDGVAVSTYHNFFLTIVYKLFSDAKFRKKVVELSRSADLWAFNTVCLYEMLR